MLALSLGLIVMAGLAGLFAGAGQSHAALQSLSRLQESARYALAFIGQSARAAGYRGCLGRDGRVINTLNGTLETLFPVNLNLPLEAIDDNAGGRATDFAIRAGIDPGKVVAGTDMVAFRGMRGPLLRVSEPVASYGDVIVERREKSGLRSGDFAILGDCEQAALFRISDMVESPGRIRLRRDPGSGALDNAAGKPLSVVEGRYGPASLSGGATIGRVVTEVYFIGHSRSVDRAGNPIRSLWRRSGMARAAELVEGIDDLQVALGIDTRPNDGEATISRFVGADAVPPGAIIRAVQVRVRASGPNHSRSFSQSFGLRNAG